MNIGDTLKIRNQVIRKTAMELGFDEVGVTSPEILREGEAVIDRWVKKGLHGTMAYLAALQKRRELFLENFPEPRSVIVLGVNYFSRSPYENKTPGLSGKIARYAWGRDYHDVIRRKHQALIERFRKEFGPDFAAKSCIDAQPVPERFAATKAGLGFVGKHTGLLNQRFGPWLFLSEIVTNYELEEDIPSSGDCGTCDHCQRACPTGALDQDYEMDARLCIAYLTIEHKGTIPRELRPKIKNWIFGCDECLNICPFTSKSRQTSWDELKPEAGVGAGMDIDTLFTLDSNSKYRKYFEGTALLRAGRKQMLRNACIVLGNSGKKEAIPYLMKAIADKAPLVRTHAAWALGRLCFHEARQILRDRQKMETDPGVMEEIQTALEENI